LQPRRLITHQRQEPHALDNGQLPGPAVDQAKISVTESNLWASRSSFLSTALPGLGRAGVFASLSEKCRREIKGGPASSRESAPL
jgi:hypothetical protein